MFVACGIWCLADVSDVSPSSEQTRDWVCCSGGLMIDYNRKLIEKFKRHNNRLFLFRNRLSRKNLLGTNKCIKTNKMYV